ncbi:hypothetical protein PoB_004124800 [Plakobranchus ocellatus]|uniref:Uncharacterized protein n=1 Tax=Plakobranchus ocellatus TaxID=259542 RepID=A0AAV4B7H1_9GAST|nr:hypothetical protein PoB_004124800 [Plakobranchus ocellatus]
MRVVCRAIKPLGIVVWAKARLATLSSPVLPPELDDPPFGRIHGFVKTSRRLERRNNGKKDDQVLWKVPKKMDITEK